MKRPAFIEIRLLCICLALPGLAQSLPRHRENKEHSSSPQISDLSDFHIDPKRRLDLEQALMRRDYKSAETILVEESERDPKSPQAARLLIMAGGIFFLDGQYLNSVIALKRADAITALDDRSRFTLAMAYVRLDRRDWARTELEKLAAAQPHNPLYLYWQARLDYDAQDYQSSIARLQKVIELDPTMMRAYDSLGLCYDYLGQSNEAITNYTRAVELNRSQSKPSPWPHVDLAVTLIALNRLTEAEHNLREAIKYDARLPQAYYQLGRLLVMRGDHRQAADALRHAIDVDATLPEPHLLLGQIYHRLGESKLAEAEIERYQQLKKNTEALPARNTSTHSVGSAAPSSNR
jgi:Flp pilus assembly protein TadD